MAKFSYGNMYAMRYNPKLKETLPFWDKTPLMIPLSIGSTHTLGLNIHWIPGPYRKRFVEWLLDLTIKKGTRKGFARVTYNVLKRDVALKKALQGIRLYINARATQVIKVPKKDIQEFFLPRQVNSRLFRKYRSKKVFRRAR